MERSEVSPREFLTVQDVAVLIERSAARVRQLEAAGELKATMRTASGIRLFERAIVEAYLRTRG